MNREIKFRAWNGEKMIYRNLHDRNWYSEDLGGKLVQIAHPDDKRLLSTMEYTGLKDKNGIFIYESDIVRVLNKPYECENSIVMWGKKSHGWSVKCNIIKDNAYDPSIKYYGLESGLNIEVIGNIYENTELCKQQQNH